jgi:ribonuclease T1
MVMSRVRRFQANCQKLVLASLLLVAAALPVAAWAKEQSPAPSGAVIALSQLPAQGQQTYARIHQGGPFEFEKDGVVFGNRERQLPGHKRGYYREYTVKTPGLRHRGAQRIVCGGQPTTPDACYYTADHYASFRRIVP